METIEAILTEVPLFVGMDPEELELLAGCAKNARFTEGEVLFREGDPADTFYVIRHGTVSLEVFVPGRGPVPIESLERGEVLGYEWVFPPYRRHFDARALSLVRATVFDATCLRWKCDDDPALGYNLMSRFAQVLIERLLWTRLRLLDVYGLRREA